MQKSSLRLRVELKEAIIDLECPQTLSLAVGTLSPQLGKGKAVQRGGLLAARSVQRKPDLVSPVAGKVQLASPDFFEIKTDNKAEDPEPVDFSLLEGADLVEKLLSFGMDVSNLVPSQQLVINALEPEPAVAVHTQLLRDEKSVLVAGLELVQKIVSPSRILLALPSGNEASLATCENFFVNPVYPYNMDELVLMAISGKRVIPKTAVLSLAQLYALGEIAKTGLPSPRVIVTVEGKNYRVPVGTPVQYLLDAAGIVLYPEDQVLLGGPFRGQSIFNTVQGVGPKDMAVTVVRNGAYPAVADVPCLNCGECVRACPVGLTPNMIGRYAEYNLFDHTLKYHIHACIECGMCSYSCIAQRPVLQYIQLAKAELRKSVLPKMAG